MRAWALLTTDPWHHSASHIVNTQCLLTEWISVELFWCNASWNNLLLTSLKFSVLCIFNNHLSFYKEGLFYKEAIAIPLKIKAENQSKIMQRLDALSNQVCYTWMRVFVPLFMIATEEFTM